jgi:hypothetical protein
MAAKKRTPKGRSPAISAEALRLFQRGRALQRSGHARHRGEYCDVVNDLRRELGLEFHDYSPLDVPNEPPKQLLHLAITQSWGKIFRLRQALEEADRESRRRPPAAKAEPEGGGGDGGE